LSKENLLLSSRFILFHKLRLINLSTLLYISNVNLIKTSA